ncbi:MBL fold metallo-hydrolase [Pseudomonas corrugata]|uniref:MBL fold metallo-hydrolase n=1 Tax=Pseudomonas corrugata TaxID=47879 RepID=UPI0015860DD7|nr:MBL fold metallo-hydrolase [Pseudomonas corrugata]MCI0995684.1 MBL fold metallo-hydrolase [Pseudomonas corrugata]NUT69288.1 MBL fold metallo-hydrolase [Pseudomonas corrugata]
MKQIYDDLWQTAPEHPFMGVTSHAYLFTQKEGNILFYNSGKIEFDKVASLGGISCQYLSHRDEAGNSLASIKQHFASKVYCHELEAASIKRYTTIDGLFDKRETRFGRVEIIPTPGHTDGSVCFFVHSPFGKKYLFTGDTIYVENGVWESRINRGDGGSKKDIIESLRLLGELTPDVVISSASVGDTAFKEIALGEWRIITNNVIKGLSQF